MEQENKDKAEKAAGFIAGLLTGWGVPANWARIIAGAVIGAALTAVTMYTTSCTVDFTQTADGSTFHGTLVPVEELMK